MSGNQRVQNISRGYSMKHRQAEKAVATCSAEWVEYGVSIRDLTVAEAIAARNKQAADREPLPLPEIPGVVFRSPSRSVSAMQEMALAWEANRFCAQWQ